MGMWTADMGRCPSCPDKETCAVRKKITLALSTLTHEINTDEALVEGPGEGIIIGSCSHPR